LLIGLKSTANAQLPALLGQLEPSPRAIVLLQNGLGGEDLVAAAAPEAVVIGAICEIACSRVGPARVRHYAHGLVHLAPFQRCAEAQQVCAAVADDLSAAGVPVEINSCLVSMRWHKLVWNIAFSGLCTVSGLRTLELLADPQLRQRLLGVMQEVVAAASADGAELEADLIATFVAKTEAMVSYAPSMQLDAMAGRPLELEAIYREPLRRARRCGVAMPETSMLLQELERL
jgi:2-dehydropantoate 2-reductase